MSFLIGTKLYQMVVRPFENVFKMANELAEFFPTHLVPIPN